MSRSRHAGFPALCGALLAAALFAGACGGASATPSSTATPKVSPTRASAAPSVSARASGSAAASAGASGSTIGLPHVNAALEDLLPDTIGGIALVQFSEPLSTLVANSQGGEKNLYGPWLVKFGKTADDVDVAIGVDWTSQIDFHVLAIAVPGVAAATLSSTFGDTARSAGWPVTARTVALKPVLEITDPTAGSGVLAVGYVYAKDGLLFVIVTDDANLLVEALLKLG
jgi:hypothetical protein